MKRKTTAIDWRQCDKRSPLAQLCEVEDGGDNDRAERRSEYHERLIGELSLYQSDVLPVFVYPKTSVGTHDGVVLATGLEFHER